jgi:hypothetical protein
MTSQPAPGGFRRLFEPLEIGNFAVRNRIVVATHGSGLGDARDLRYLQERARGGAGLLGIHSSGGVYGYAIGPGRRSTAPDWDGKGLSPVTREGIAHYDEVMLPGLRRRAEVIHAEGGRCFAQVYHSGAARHGINPMPRWPQPRFKIPTRRSAPIRSPSTRSRNSWWHLPMPSAEPRWPGSMRLRSMARTAIWSTSSSRPISIGAQTVGRDARGSCLRARNVDGRGSPSSSRAALLLMARWLRR